jgi:hypothetical protein
METSTPIRATPFCPSVSRHKLGPAWPRVVALVASTLAMASCASTNLQPLNGTALRATHPRTIVTTRLAPPDFVPGGGGAGAVVAFGLIGVIAEASIHAQGVALVARDGIEDPATSIRSELAGVLARKYGLQEVSGENIPAKGIRQTQLAVAMQDADLVLDVRTTDWGLKRSGRAGGYDVTYAGRMKLVDSRTGTVIAQGPCQSPPVDPELAPSYETILANGGTVLKAMLASAAESCVDEFRSRIIGVY